MNTRSTLTIEQLHGTGVGIKLPGSVRAEYDLDRISEVIVREWLIRRMEPDLKLDHRPIPWLTRTVYEFLRPALDDKRIDVMDDINDRLNDHNIIPRFTSQDASKRNPFYLAILAFFASTPESITPQIRDRVSKELWYAFRHYVPLPFLPGFLLQVRSRGLGQRAMDGELEPNAHDWIVEQRSRKSFNHQKRGPYPDAIESAVMIRKTARSYRLRKGR